MAKEKTFVLLKPDCIKRGLVGEVISRIEMKGWRIIEAKTRKLDPLFLYAFYDHIKDEPFFLDVFNYMLSGPVLGLVVEGEHALEGMRRIIGPPLVEDCLPGTIRGDFAAHSANNLIHASACSKFFKKEREGFFGPK